MFENQRILVTGSSRGIGFATAKAFLDAGARVAVNGRTAKSTADGIERLGGSDRLIAAAGDVVDVYLQPSGMVLLLPRACKAILQAFIAKSWQRTQEDRD